VFVQDRLSGDPKKLNEVLQQFMAELRKRPELTGLNTFFRPTVPQLLVEVDREKAISLGIPVSDVFDALQSTMGVLYVNDFNKFRPCVSRADASRERISRAARRPWQRLCPVGHVG
jgi:HAE1 family hydrophobic/amphiphilic exporter-1/multidrug efflux pump